MLREIDAEWKVETGQPMPRGVDEVVIAARMAGFSADYAETGNYTLNEVYRQAIAAKKLTDNQAVNRKLMAAEIAQEMAAIDPDLVGDRWEKILGQISLEAKKTLVALRSLVAVSRDQPARRSEVAELAGLSANQVRRVLERELPYLGVDLFESIPGCRGGLWLTHEGAIVADKIDDKILPRKKSSLPNNGIRRIVRA
jgi:hypothetical protein